MGPKPFDNLLDRGWVVTGIINDDHRKSANALKDCCQGLDSIEVGDHNRDGILRPLARRPCGVEDSCMYELRRKSTLARFVTERRSSTPPLEEGQPKR
jgi:hypothetical protein